MEEKKPQEFYIGYLDKAPKGIAATVKAAVAATLAVALALAGLFALSQGAFPASVFEFGVIREFRGVIRSQPSPSLLVDRPDSSPQGSGASRFHLVMPFKFGAQDAASRFDGQAVRLRGSLIYRGDQTMIEVEPESIVPDPQGGAASASGLSEHLGPVTLRGEIVDSKCYLGVMNPGSGKVHRACASLCIRGGIPPLFAATEPEGAWKHYLLVSSDGSAVNQKVLELVGEVVEISGEVVRYDDLLVLRADPANYRRVAQ